MAAHGDDYDVVNRNELTFSSDAKIVTTTSVIIRYLGGVNHKFEKYGYRERAYPALDANSKWDKGYSINPIVNTKLGDYFEIDNEFSRELQGVVNDHIYPEVAYEGSTPTMRRTAFGWEPILNNNISTGDHR